MRDETTGKIEQLIETKAQSPEQAERLKQRFQAVLSAPPPTGGPSVNMFELTVALCAAAQVGRYDVLDQKTVYLAAVKLAEMFFTRSGDFIERA